MTDPAYQSITCQSLKMKNRRLIFAVFSAAILFSMVREWKTAVACTRTTLVPSAVASQGL